MALPKDMRLKGHRTFNYIHKNSITYHGKLMTFKVANSNPSILLTHKITNTSNNFRVAIAISKKVSKKAVERNKLRRILQEWLLIFLMFANSHSCRILLNLFRSTAFFETFLLIAIAILRLFEVFLNLWDKSIAGFDLATLNVINFP